MGNFSCFFPFVIRQQRALNPLSHTHIDSSIYYSLFFSIFSRLPNLLVCFFQISWMRKRDLHILTSNNFLYTGDQRFSVIHPQDSDEWNLKIEYAQPKDAGTYECQVSTASLSALFFSAGSLSRPYLNSENLLRRFHFPFLVSFDFYRRLGQY